MKQNLKNIQGNYRDISGSKKRWQERIKYKIIIDPIWGNPENSKVTISTEIEHRLNDRFEWELKNSADNENKISEIFQCIDRIDK